MTLQHVIILFQLIAFLFAISVHESAHAWMANRQGDPTARMLGRISLNPIKHIDPIGTVLLPLIAMLTHFPVIGWAKPTPVDPRNFKNPVRDDILTSVAGPVSNFIVATGATILLAAIAAMAPGGRMLVRETISGFLSGMRPTGKLHLGNYVGALRNGLVCRMTTSAFFSSQTGTR
jgi:Zn-dependent protease